MEEGRDYGVALAQAQKLGFAEADPTFDVSGRDAAQKLLILASLAFGVQLTMKDVPAEGIEHVSATDFAYAREFGFHLEAARDGAAARGSSPAERAPGARPAWDSAVHDPGRVQRGGGLFVRARTCVAGGQGAGALPTGSAVVSDIIEAGRNLVSRTVGRVPHLAWADGVQSAKLAQPGSRVGPWYLRFSVSDEPGVLARSQGRLGPAGSASPRWSNGSMERNRSR